MTEKVIYRELPTDSQLLRLWEMTDAQRELTGLAADLRKHGIEVRFESDEINEGGVRFLKRLNAICAVMDAHVLDFNAFHQSRRCLSG